MTRAPMPGLSALATFAALATDVAPCYVCTVDVEPGVDLRLTVTSLSRPIPVHRDHLGAGVVAHLLASVAA
jgi:hypothetical protein